METNQSLLTEPAAWLAEVFCVQFREALEQFTGLECRVESGTAGDIPPGVSWWRQPFSLNPAAGFFAGAADADWKRIGQAALAVAGIDGADQDALRDTYLELVRQAVSGTADQVGATVGMPVSALDGAPTEKAPGSAAAIRITLGLDATAIVVLAVEEELLESLRDAALAAIENPGQSRLPATIPPAASLEPASFDLLAEVELPVSVSFGRTYLLLKEALKLTSGSIIELNRNVSEPVELIVNNCVIARGEVVVIEGNYGVRIQEIVSPNERLRTLH